MLGQSLKAGRFGLTVLQDRQMFSGQDHALNKGFLRCFGVIEGLFGLRPQYLFSLQPSYIRRVLRSPQMQLKISLAKVPLVLFLCSLLANVQPWC